MQTNMSISILSNWYWALIWISTSLYGVWGEVKAMPFEEKVLNGYIDGISLDPAYKASESQKIKSTVHDLNDHLFANYSTYIRPRLNQSESVLVNFYIGLRQILDVDVKAQQMKLFLWQRQTWFDEFLRWDPSQFGNISQLFVSPDKIWVPDVIFQNSVNGVEDLSKSSPIKILLLADGIVNFYRPTIQSTTCIMEVRYFPYDLQECTFNIGSWMLHENEVNIHVFDFNEGTLSDTQLIEHHEWGLRDRTVLRRQVFVDMVLGGTNKSVVYPYLEFQYLFERKPEFYEKNVIVPTALICALSTIVFLLPNESGEKLTFSVTVFLTFCVNLLVVTNQVPASSMSFPIIGHYYLTCICIVAVSIFLTTIVLTCHFVGEHLFLSPIPPLIKNITFNYMAPFLGFEMKKSLSVFCRCRKRRRSSKNRTYKFSTFETRRMKSSFDLPVNPTNHLLLSKTKLTPTGEALPDNIPMSEICGSLLKIETYLRDATQDEIKKHHKNIVAEEWKLFSRVMDRFFAVTYGIVTCCFTAYFMYAIKSKPDKMLEKPYFLDGLY